MINARTILLLLLATLAGCSSPRDQQSTDPRLARAQGELQPLHRRAMALADTLGQLQQQTTDTYYARMLGAEKWAWVQQDSTAKAIRLQWNKSMEKLTPPVTQLYLMADRHWQLLRQPSTQPEDVEALLQIHEVMIARLRLIIPVQRQRLAQWRTAYVAYLQSCSTGACYILPPQ